MNRLLLAIFLFISLFVNAQVFQENFNSGIPATWSISNNGFGLGQSWLASPTSLGNSNSIGVMVANETASTVNPIQDWLISPAINLTGVVNPQITFYGKTTPAGPNRGSVLKVMVSTTGINPANFQLIETFTETYNGATNPISPNSNFDLKTINLTGYSNQNIHVAFVMENTGLGKTWILDDFSVFERCLDPTNITVNNINLTSCTVSWDNPGGASSFQIELVSGTNQPTGVATHTATTNSINLPLTFGVNYRVYVRSVCTGNFSQWMVSNQFTPLAPGTDCSSAMPITSLPFTHSDTTANYGDDYNGFPGNGCVTTGNYLSGDDVVYAFTPTENMIVNIELIPGGNSSGIFVYNSCANIGIGCIAGVANTNATVRNINDLSLIAGTTYYIVISTSTAIQSVQYTLNIERVFCPSPLASFMNITSNSAYLNIQNGQGSNSTSWQIFVQNTSDNEPTTSGTVVGVTNPLITTLQNGTPLQPATTYEVYVRALCPDGNYSPWAGPFYFSTECVAYNLPFTETFDSDSATQLCWTVYNNNFDSRQWMMDYNIGVISGNESVSINAAGVSNNDLLVSPVLNFAGQYRLRYKYKVGATTPQNFSVTMSTNGGTLPNDFTTVLVPDTGYSNTTVKEKVVYLPNFTGLGAISWNVTTNAVSRIWIDDVVIEEVPSCPEPYDVVNLNSTATSMLVDWQQFGTALSWEIVLVPAGTIFTGNTTGLTVYSTTVKPYQVDNLPSGTYFDIYVRSNCSATNQSTWSLAGSGVTSVANDECVDALEIPVNEGTDCIESITANFIGATTSNLGTNCLWTSNNDIWFEFTATATRHMLNISNIQGNSTTIYAALYSGTCDGGLTLLECDTFTPNTASNIYDALTIGETYYVKIYTNVSPATTIFTACVLTPLQPIRTSNNEYTVPELVTDILINNPCAEVSNITWSTGENGNGLMGIGYFEKNNSSFSFNDGVILSTGNILNAPGPKSAGSQGATAGNWGSDADLSAILATQGLNGSLHNTTKLEFDFTAITNFMSFNFLFASEEYGTFQCGYSDIFAFLLTDLSTGVTTNIAVIPNTNIPVSVTTIRNNQYNTGCPSANPQYFDAYYDGIDAASIGAPINFRGHTIPMIAQSQVTPGTTYHIKLAIADYNDSGYDSAVFIEGGSFQLGTVNLGTDLTVEANNAICSTTSYTLDSGIDLNQYTIEWLKDGVVIPGQNGPILEVTESGEYTIEATYIGSSCAISDSILVEIFPLFLNDFAEPEKLKVCVNSDRIVDLTSNEVIVLNGLSATDFSFEYFKNLNDLTSNFDPILNPQSYIVNYTQDIYVKVTNLYTGCEEYFFFNVEFIDLDELVNLKDVTACTAYLLPALPENQNYFTGPDGTGEKLTKNTYLGVGEYKIYVRTENDICSQEKSFNVSVIECYIQKGISPNGDGLNDYLDLEFFNAQKVEIFNRYGVKVYTHGSGYTNQWHGQSTNGDELPSGTYFYTIQSPFETFTGWIQLVREQN